MPRESGDDVGEGDDVRAKEPAATPIAPSASHVSDPVAEAMVLALLEEEDRRREEREYSRFAMLLNPMAMATLLPMYGIATIPVDVQIGWRYVGIDLLLTGIVGELNGFVAEIGPRITPAGRGLDGFYMVPRVGGGYPLGFMVEGELGYSWIIGHFALNLGAGCGWASEGGVLPFGNLSLGFAV